MRSTRLIRLPIRSLLLAVLVASSVHGADWTAAPSTYTHDPRTGRRVDQFAQKEPAMFYPNPSFRRSGFRHSRTSIQYGGIADHRHVIEKWGEEPVQPYGEWRFPYRPHSSPYPNWGPPPGFYGGVGVGPAFGQFGFPVGGQRGHGGGGRGGYHPPANGQPNAAPGNPPVVNPPRRALPATPNRWRPWHDGGYPQLPDNYYLPQRSR